MNTTYEGLRVMYDKGLLSVQLRGGQQQEMQEQGQRQREDTLPIPAVEIFPPSDFEPRNVGAAAGRAQAVREWLRSVDADQ